MNYYPFHIGDFTAHTSHLTWEEDIAYRRMLDSYYLREQPLPSEVVAVARLIRMRDSQEAIKAVLSEFFVLLDDGWHQTRCDEEIAKMKEKQAESEAKDEHERNRMRRHRERRSEMFAWLRERGVVPAWDVSIKDLQRLCDENGMPPETHLKREQVETGNAPETAKPTPTPTPTPTPKKERVTQPAARPADVSESVWGEFVEFRKKRKQVVTDLVVKTVKEKGGEVGLTLEESMADWVTANTQGFFPQARKKAVQQNAPAESFAERDQKMKHEQFYRNAGIEPPKHTTGEPYGFPALA